MNFFDADLKKEGETYIAECQGLRLDIGSLGQKLEEKGYLNKEIILGIRPEHIYDESRKRGIKINGEVSFLEELGSEKYIYLDLQGLELLAKINTDKPIARKSPLELYIDEGKLHFFDKESKNNIIYG